jgi:enamine deaminase RidA (YjgF/YER057c/UK114 family)
VNIEVYPDDNMSRANSLAHDHQPGSRSRQRRLFRVDELLNLAGTDKSQLLSAQVWIADMRLFEDHNSVWNEWVDPANPPARACLTTDFWRPGMLVEVMVVAAVP